MNQSIGLTMERLKSNDIPVKEMRVGLHERIVMPAELVLSVSNSKAWLLELLEDYYIQGAGMEPVLLPSGLFS